MAKEAIKRRAQSSGNISPGHFRHREDCLGPGSAIVEPGSIGRRKKFIRDKTKNAHSGWRERDSRPASDFSMGRVSASDLELRRQHCDNASRSRVRAVDRLAKAVSRPRASIWFNDGGPVYGFGVARMNLEPAATLTHLTVAEGPRLILRHLRPSDAAFILELVNDPAWLSNIGDRNIHSLDDAERYIRTGPQAMYAKHGFGLFAVERKDDGAVMGLCGLLKRDTLDDVDIGFAFLPAYRGQGYALEAAEATLALGRYRFSLRRIVAITSPANADSAKLLLRLGMHLEGDVNLASDAETLCLYALEFSAADD